MQTINLAFETAKSSMQGLESSEEIMLKLGAEIVKTDHPGYNVAWFKKSDAAQFHKVRSMCHRLVKFGAIVETDNWIMLPYMAKNIPWKLTAFSTD